MKKIALALMLILAFMTGCSQPADDAADNSTVQQGQQTTGGTASDTANSASEPQGFPFKAYGQEIYVCMEAAPLLEALPEPNDKFESPSCAFEGVDITYFYPGFELTTYPENGKEYVLSVTLTDDSVTTSEGVYIGGSKEDIESALGGGYTENGSQIIYTKGGGDLIFSLDGGVIVGILYAYKV